MPINIVVGLVALFVALIMHSLGALGAFRAKAITRRHATYIWIGLAFDVVATAMMAIEAGGQVGARTLGGVGVRFLNLAVLSAPGAQGVSSRP
jgi:hypothetical protein